MRLRELRQSKHLTQAELGAVLKVSASTIGMYEQGRREPDNPMLTKMADYFGVSIDYLIGRDSSFKTASTRQLPTTDFINSLFANDPEGLARINQATIEINGLESLDYLSDETRVLIKNALLLAAQEVDRIKAGK